MNEATNKTIGETMTTQTTKRGLKIHFRRDKEAIAFMRYWKAVGYKWPWEESRYGW